MVQPSGAASEIVFSILSASFDDPQESALSDYLQASAMLQYKRFSILEHFNYDTNIVHFDTLSHRF